MFPQAKRFWLDSCGFIRWLVMLVASNALPAAMACDGMFLAIIMEIGKRGSLRDNNIDDR
jgi:hypothetical protein